MNIFCIPCNIKCVSVPHAIVDNDIDDMRWKHCHECGICVPDLDHHCDFFGKCITGKNLWQFYIGVGLSIFNIIVMFLLSMIIQ